MVETLRVHIAELVIATDPAAADVTIADSISERAEAKGLAIVARESRRGCRRGDSREARGLHRRSERRCGDRDRRRREHRRRATRCVRSSRSRCRASRTCSAGSRIKRSARPRCCRTPRPRSARARSCSCCRRSRARCVEAMDKLILPQLDPATTAEESGPADSTARTAGESRARRHRSIDGRVAEARGGAAQDRSGADRVRAGNLGADAGGEPGARADAKKKTGPHVIRKEPPPDVTRQIDRNELERTLRKQRVERRGHAAGDRYPQPVAEGAARRRRE